MNRFLNWLVKLSHGTIWNRTARTSRLTHDPQRMLARLKYLKTTFHNSQRYDVGMLWAEDNTQIPNNYFLSLVLLKFLKKQLTRDTALKENYAKTIDEDIQKGYVLTVPDAHMVKQLSDEEWYLPHQPVVNPNKPGKTRRVLNGAVKFPGNFFEQICSLAPNCSEINPCTTQNSRTSICRVRIFGRYVPPGW